MSWIVLPSGNTVEATFVRGNTISSGFESPLEYFIRSMDHFVVESPTGKLVINANAVLIEVEE